MTIPELKQLLCLELKKADYYIQRLNDKYEEWSDNANE